MLSSSLLFKALNIKQSFYHLSFVIQKYGITLKQAHILQVFENEMLSKISEHNRDEVNGK
jgi:hypothetical protein